MKSILSLVFACAATSLAQQRPPLVAVMPLQARGVDSNATRILEDALADGLVGTGSVRLMERAQMAQVLGEQGFQESGTCDQSECAVQMGKMLGVERAVVGSVGLLGKTYVMNMRLVDIASGEILKSSQQRLTGEIDQVLSDLVPKVVSDLTRTGAAPAKVATPKSAEPVPGKKSHAWIWWTTGGVLVAGGAAAAAVLVLGGKSATTIPPNQNPDPGTNGSSDGTLVIDLGGVQ